MKQASPFKHLLLLLFLLAAYLLTVTTADGRNLTFRLVKQYGQR